MDFLKILGLSLSSVIALFLLSKIMGNKEISQLSMFDYVIGITIGSIAAEMATALENDFWQPLLAMAVYAIVTILISAISRKSLAARRLINGKSYILLDNGVLFYKNFSKAQIDLNEFLVECRNKGYFNIADIQTAIFEPNGKISFLPKSLKRPSTPEDLNLNVAQENVVTNLILDGKILKENLKSINKDENWLLNNLKLQGYKKLSHIFLATCDNNLNLSVYAKNSLKTSHDSFE